jgi:hypothetical protein
VRVVIRRTPTWLVAVLTAAMVILQIPSYYVPAIAQVAPPVAAAHDGSVVNWTSRLNLPAPRFGAAAVHAGGYVYVIGGASFTSDGSSGAVGESVNTVFAAKINDDGSLGAFGVVAALNSTRMFAGAYVQNRTIYVFGGYGGGNRLNDWAARNTIERTFVNPDGTLDAWTVLPTTLTSARGGVGVFSPEATIGRLYLVGGETGFGTTGRAALATTESITFAALNGATAGTWRTEAPLPAARRGHATTGSRSRVLVTGGNDVSGQVTKTIFRGDVSLFTGNPDTEGTLTWSTLATQMPVDQGVADHAQAVSNGVLYFAGGTGNSTNVLSWIAVNTDQTLAGAWTNNSAGPAFSTTTSSPMIAVDGVLYYFAHNFARTDTVEVTVHQNSPPSATGWTAERQGLTPRFIHATATMNGRIYTLGGMNRRMFSAATNSVDTIYPAGGATAGGSPMLRARLNFAAIGTHGAIFAVGGRDDANTLLSSVEWTRVNSDGSFAGWAETTPLPEPRQGHGLAVIGDELYVFGGQSTDFSALSTIIKATIGETGLGAWTNAGFLPIGLFSAPIAQARGFTYSVSGSFPTTPGNAASQNDVRRWEGGESWTAVESLPTGADHAVAVGNTLVAFGGFSSRTAYYSFVRSDGTITPWTALPPTVFDRTFMSPAALGNMLWVTGGLGSVNATGLNSTMSSVERMIAPAAPVVPNNRNHTWITALPLADGEPVEDGLTRFDQSTWYRIPIAPQTTVRIDLTQLPANYSLTAYRDLRAIARALRDGATSTTALRASQVGDMVADDIDSDDIDSDDIDSDDIDSDDIDSDDIDSDDIDSDDIDSDDIDSDDIDSDDIDSDDIDSDGDQDTGFGPVYSAAQQRGLRAVSANAGLAPESITFNTRDLSEDLYIRVRGHHGAFDPDRTFQLVASRIAYASCIDAALARRSPSTLATALPEGKRTLILTNTTALGLSGAAKTAFRALLDQLAARPEAVGAVVDLADDANVQLQMADLAAAPTCVTQANFASDTIGELVGRFRERNPAMEYIVIAGGDHAVPYRRVADRAEISREHRWSPPVDPLTRSEASLIGDYFLSDDFYASDGPVEILGATLTVPRIAVGRLVETPADISAYLAAYLAPGGAHAMPTTALSSGYDFNLDLADYISQQLGTRGVTVDSTLQSNTWSSADWRNAVLGTQRFGILSLQGHFSATRLVPADNGQRVLSTEISGLTDSRFLRTLVLSIGCHSGYNIADADAGLGTQPLSFPEAFLSQGATLVGGTGYQYGETVLMKNTEALLAKLVLELGYSDDTSFVTYANGVPIGKALLNAKRAYLQELQALRGIDEKVIGVSTLYGVPFMTFTLPNTTGRPQPPAVTPTPVGGFTGLATYETSETITLGRDGAAAAESFYFFGDRQGTSVSPYRPIAPTSSTDVSVDGTLPRGVVFLGGDYREESFVPRLSVPATEETGGAPSYVNQAFTPVRPVRLNQLSGDARVLTPFQYRSNATGSAGTARVFTTLNTRVYYSSRTGNAAITAAPLLSNITLSQTATGLDVSVDVSYETDPGVAAVFVTYTNTSAANRSWQSILMTGGAPTPRTIVNAVVTGQTARYTASIATTDPFAIRLMIQGVSGVGLVSVAANDGFLYALQTGTGPTPVGPDTTLTVTAPASVAHRSAFTASATLRTAAAALGGKTVAFTFGGQHRTATTNGSGVASVTLEASMAPRDLPYAVEATFAGDADGSGSGGSASVLITPAATALTPSTPSGLQYSDNAVIATLRTGTTTLNEQPVFISLTDSGGSTRLLATATDFAGRVRFDTMDFGGVAPGSYAVHVDYPGSERYLSSMTDLTVVVAAEAGTVVPTVLGPQAVGPVTLTAQVTQEADGALGDLALARIEYTLRPDVGAPIVLLAPVTSTGTSSFTTTLASGLYSIDARLVGHYTSATVTQVMPVYDPSTFATGGGWVLTTAGSSLVPAGKKANFGFNVKYKENGIDPTGSLNVTLKEAGLDLKAVTFDWLIISGGRAEFEGAATSGTLTGLRFRVIAFDRSPDSFEIRVWDASGSFDAPTYRIANNLGGGSVQIH